MRSVISDPPMRLGDSSEIQPLACVLERVARQWSETNTRGKVVRGYLREFFTTFLALAVGSIDLVLFCPSEWIGGLALDR